MLVCGDEHRCYLARAGITRNDDFGHEIAVGTDPVARGRGLARRLVARAARSILAGGALPIYRHELANEASARVDDGAGFPELRWRALEVAELRTGARALELDQLSRAPSRPGVRRWRSLRVDARALLDYGGCIPNAWFW